MPKEYALAESVEAIAKTLLPTYHAELATARILYMFVDTGSQENGRPVYGKVKKVSGPFEFLLEKDFIIEVALDSWNELDEDHRQALVDHLLERCLGEEDEKSGGAMKWSVRKPDVQEFATILRRHGAWTAQLESMVSVAQELDLDERVQEIANTQVQSE